MATKKDDYKNSVGTSFKERLKGLRDRYLELHGEMSVAEFNDKVGVDSGTWSHWTKSKYDTYPGLWNLVNIVKITGCSLDWLILGMGDYNPTLPSDEIVISEKGKFDFPDKVISERSSKTNYEMEKVGECPKCGAPIYNDGDWSNGRIPPAVHTCECHKNTNP